MSLLIGLSVYLTTTLYGQERVLDRQKVDRHFAGMPAEPSAPLPLLPLGQNGKDKNVIVGKEGSETQQDTAQDFERLLVAQWKKALGELRSTQEHSKFVQENQALFKFIGSDIENGIRLGMGSIAAYVHGAIYFNRVELREMAAQFKRKGAPDEQVLRFLALKTLPVVVHEIRHGMNAKELAYFYGLSYPLTCFEEEVVAFFDAGQVLKEIEESYPDLGQNSSYSPFDSMVKSLEEAWEKGPGGIGHFVQSRYSALGLLSSDREILIQDCLECSREVEGELKELALERRKLEGLLLQENNPKALEASRVELGRLDIQADMLNLNKKANEAALKILQDSKQFKVLRQFYREKLNAMGEQSKRWKK